MIELKPDQSAIESSPLAVLATPKLRPGGYASEFGKVRAFESLDEIAYAPKITRKMRESAGAFRALRASRGTGFDPKLARVVKQIHGHRVRWVDALVTYGPNRWRAAIGIKRGAMVAMVAPLWR